jgi:molybdopterin-guanine dinucleotide biosynthesis protein A
MQINNTIGLVMCGGQSLRMGTDKSLLQYFDKPQRYQVYEMLMPFCEQIILSCSAEQASNMDPLYPYLIDDEQFRHIGPMGALLTAFEKYPDKHLLLIGCDYPFLNASELTNFSMHCGLKPASFYNQDAAIYESMLAWYPNHCKHTIKQMFTDKEFSLQFLLRKQDAIRYYPMNTNCIKSIDTREGFIEAYNQIHTKQH